MDSCPSSGWDLPPEEEVSDAHGTRVAMHLNTNTVETDSAVGRDSGNDEAPLLAAKAAASPAN